MANNEKSPGLTQDAVDLKFGADASLCAMPPAQDAKGARTSSGASAAQMAQAFKAAADKPPAYTCQQALWLTFYFDGTGNNLDADVGTAEHSNVARLFRARIDDDATVGRHSIYIPGIGTYFKDIGDPGGTLTGNGFGAKGEARLAHAFKLFDQYVNKAYARANNPTNKITLINVAAFGFSRGAALARAFANRLAAQCKQVGAGWRFSRIDAPIRLRFLGLFDTVASVGMPTATSGALMLRPDPVEIAFGRPGADPTRFSFSDGHADWADELAIPDMTEQCVHYVAAHEFRNSFPLDSVFRGGRKSAHCREVVYPGAHSNVGGGYRPGEGGRSQQKQDMLSLIPLRAMYDEALAAGVPLNTLSNVENPSDFETDPTLATRFNHYMNQAGWGGRSPGEMVLSHMRLYYAWRWRYIRQKQQKGQSAELGGNGETAETHTIRRNEAQFKRDKDAADREVERIEREDAENIRVANLYLRQAQQARDNYAMSQYNNPGVMQGMQPYDARVADAERNLANTQDRLRRAKAKRDTLPGTGELIGALQKYDRLLLQAVQSILHAINLDPHKRNQLRPHYRALVETYEAEYVQNKGLRDADVIAFFNTYVHDSLAAFDKDGTNTSDPRVIYVGRDMKLRYAQLEAPAPQQPRAA